MFGTPTTNKMKHVFHIGDNTSVFKYLTIAKLSVLLTFPYKKKKKIFW